MTAGVPLLLRGALLLERLAAAVHRRSAALTQHVALRRVPAASRAAVTASIYSGQQSFAPGGARFAESLFPWEERALEHSRWPRTGRILVGGAGGGREVAGLAARGYEVVGFDPSPGLVTLGRAGLDPAGRPELVVGSYEDLIAATRASGGPLAGVVARAPYDGVVLGWGSLSHVLDPGLVVELLATTRGLAPAGPVLLSYMRHAPEARPGLTDGEDGAAGALRFAPHCGFYRTHDEGELRSIAAAAGYDVVLACETPYPHALLVPARG